MRGQEFEVRVALTVEDPWMDWGDDVHPDRALQASMRDETVEGDRKSWMYWREIGSPPGILVMVGFGVCRDPSLLVSKTDFKDVIG